MLHDLNPVGERSSLIKCGNACIIVRAIIAIAIIAIAITVAITVAVAMATTQSLILIKIITTIRITMTMMSIITKLLLPAKNNNQQSKKDAM